MPTGNSANTNDPVLVSLQDQIKNLTTQLADAQKKLNALQNDGNYAYYLSRVDILKAKNLFNVTDGKGQHWWADGSGVCWVGNGSEQGWSGGMGYINSIQSQMSQTSASIKNISEDQLPKAQAALDAYLKGKQNDPNFIKDQTALQTQLTNAQANAAKEAGKVAIWVWIVGGVVILGGLTALTIYLVKKSKKGGKAASAGAPVAA